MCEIDTKSILLKKIGNFSINGKKNNGFKLINQDTNVI